MERRCLIRMMAVASHWLLSGTWMMDIFAYSSWDISLHDVSLFVVVVVVTILIIQVVNKYTEEHCCSSTTTTI